jgi:hypothetical protein
MVDKVKEILKNDIQVVLKSPELSLSLLKCASVLLLNGGKPRICEAAQRNYYSQLKTKGMAKAEILEKVAKRTCKPAWNGRKYSPIAMANIFPEYLHDENAIAYLKSGALKESDFEVLPEGFKEKAAPKKRGPKTKQTE